MLKITFVGNCQARPLADFFRLHCVDEVEVETIIVHLLKDADEARYKTTLEQSDYIISQNIADNFPCGFIRTSVIRNSYPGKVLAIHNLYFRGYNPELMYIRLKGGGTVTGPLGDYHHQLIFEAWQNGLSQVKAMNFVQNLSNWESRFSLVSDTSMDELSQREKVLDVKMSETIKLLMKTQRLFFTFNHPTRSLLSALAERIALALNINVTQDVELGAEPLDLIVPPLSEFTQRQFNLECKCNNVFKGLNNTEEGLFKGVYTYSIEELIDTFYKVYDDKIDDIKKRAIIPNLGIHTT